MSDGAEKNKDSHIQVQLSDDFMSASVDLYPPSHGGRAYNLNDVLSALEGAGVRWGIQNEVLEKAVIDSLTDGKPIKGLVAAIGRKARKSVPSYWHLKKRLLNDGKADPDAPSVDYRELSPYVLVKKGEALAKQVPAASGDAGHRVDGEILPAGQKDVELFRPGENILEKEGMLYAACHGRFEIRDKIMSINESLEIAGNVDYSTGHIMFPGDVIIHGAVCDGFRVAAGGSIFVKQTMDASQVLARHDLIVEGGIKGRGEALLRIDGRIEAKFIENATIESHGDILVSKAVMHSNISTLGTVNLGEQGTIVGGKIWAETGVIAGSIGRPDSPAMELRVGNSYISDRKLRHAQAHIERLEHKLDKLKSRSSLNPKQLELIGQVEQAIEKMEQSVKTFAGELHARKDATVTVYGNICEGTEIYIAELLYRVNSPTKGVTFYYDEDGPRIAFRPSGKPSGNKA